MLWLNNDTPAPATPHKPQQQKETQVHSTGQFPSRRCSAPVDLPCRCQFILTLAVTPSLPFIDSQLCSSAPLPSNPAVIRKGQCVGSLLLCCQCWCPLLRYLLALAFGWRPNEQPVRRRSSWGREEMMSGEAYSTPPAIQYSCSFYS